MTTVAAVMRRSYSPAMFDDMDLPPHTREFDRATSVTTLTFAGDLSDEQAEAVWARMESTDDVDQVKRANLRAACGALMSAGEPETLEDALVVITLLRAASVGSLNYLLGD